MVPVSRPIFWLIPTACTAVVLGTCVGTSPLQPLGVGVVSRLDAGNVPDAQSVFDGGGEDAGQNGWRVRVQEILDRQAFAGGAVTALSESGATAGYAWRTGATDRFGWIAEVDGGAIQEWKIGDQSVSVVLALMPDGFYCGGSLWPDPSIPGSTTNTAIVGRDGSATRLLPDPVSSACRGMTRSGATIGDWVMGQGFFRWPDAGTLLFNFYPYPDGGPPGFQAVTLKSMNERNEVVGAIPPSAFYWSPDAGPTRLRIPVQYGTARANDINNRGVIVGGALDYDSYFVATVWLDASDAGKYLPRPPGLNVTEALSINDDGLIVGYGLDETYPYRSYGIVWWDGKAYLGDDLVRGQSPLPVDRFDFVNNEGRIAGTLRDVVLGADGGPLAFPTLPFVIDVLAYP